MAHEPDHAAELRKESYTMALYVAICLLAALTAASHATDHVNVFAIVWGTTLGLAVAHWFAFRVSARLVAAGSIRRHDADVAFAQLGGAAAVGLIASIPLVLFEESNELDGVRLVLAGFIGLVGYWVARAAEAGRLRSAIYGMSILVVAATVATLKNILSGH
jgi:hypothetical protein